MRRLVLLAIVLALVSVPAWGVSGYGVVETIGSGTDTITVLYTGGTPYDIGYWHGYLLKDQVRATYEGFLEIVESEIDGGMAVVDLAWSQMEPFVTEDWRQEMQGLADGSGLTLQEVHRIQAMGDAAEFHCSAFNAFGAATANGHMIQMRILDWAMETKAQDQPLIIVADPLGGHRYANIGFAGMLGCIAGISTAGIGVSEMGDDFDSPSGESLQGIPFPFLLRDVIAKAESLQEAHAMVADAHRTSSLWYVIGDAKIPSAEVFRTSAIRCETWGPGEMPSPYQGIPDVVYVGHYMDRLYPDLLSSWGTLDIDRALEITRHNAMRSNLLDAVYDLNTSEIWVAYANGLNPASESNFTYLDVKAFKRPPYVLQVTPEAGASGVSAGAVVTARFSEALSMGTVNEHTASISGPEGLVPGTVSYDAPTHTLTITPVGGLSQGLHTVTLRGGESGLKNLQGTPLLADYTWTFTVPRDDRPPVVSGLAPASGSAVRGLVTIEAQAVDASGVSRVEMFVDNVCLNTFIAPPYRVVWDTRPLSVAEGAHTIMVWAFDNLGNKATVCSQVVVDNTTFNDVPKSASYWACVETIVREGIASGCSTVPPLFCPSSGITREQMAAFLCRASGLSPQYPSTPTFTDVPRASPFYGYIEALYAAGIVSGCSAQPRLFCPRAGLTRGQFAVMLCRALALAPYAKPTPTFGDLPASSGPYGYVEALCQRRIVGGCSTTPPLFCPNQVLTRAQMAILLCRAFGLSLN